MTDSPKDQPRKPLSLKQALSTETLAQIAVLKGKSVFDSPTLSGKKNDKESLSKSIVEVGSKNPPLAETVAFLSETYPNTFSLRERKPLKLGMLQDLTDALSPKFSKTYLRKVLNSYTFNKHYQVALIEQRNRYDLDGNIAGEVTETDKAAAQSNIDAIMAKKQNAKKKSSKASLNLKDQEHTS